MRRDPIRYTNLLKGAAPYKGAVNKFAYRRGDHWSSVALYTINKYAAAVIIIRKTALTAVNKMR